MVGWYLPGNGINHLTNQVVLVPHQFRLVVLVQCFGVEREMQNKQLVAELEWHPVLEGTLFVPQALRRMRLAGWELSILIGNGLESGNKIDQVG